MIFWLLVLLLAVALLLGGALLVYVCGRRAVPDYWDESALLTHGQGARREDVLPGKAWLETKRLEPVEIDSDDELTLRGQFLRPKKGAKGTVLLFHGCRSSWKLDFSGVARFFFEQGYQIMFVDERAHGASRGRWITYGVWERFDVRGWTNYLALRFGDGHPIWIYGLGMGGTAALMASALELYGDVRGIIAEGAYTSPYQIIRHRAAELIRPLPPGPALALLNLFTSVFVGFGLREYSAEDAVRESGYPILLLHGTEDKTVPVSMARLIAKAAAGRRLTYLPVEGAGHGTCRLTDRERVEDAILSFLKQ